MGIRNITERRKMQCVEFRGKKLGIEMQNT
jgi:hypothetical protein